VRVRVVGIEERMEDANGGSDRAIFRGAIGDPMDIPDEYYYQLVLRNSILYVRLGFLKRCAFFRLLIPRANQRHQACFGVFFE
jgi:hypothetical protein